MQPASLHRGIRGWGGVVSNSSGLPADPTAMQWPWSKASQTWKHVSRGKPRFPARDLSCHLGSLVDLSESGMRVRHQGRPTLRQGDSLMFTVGSEGQCVRVAGRVAWVRRANWKAHDIGIAFLDVRPGVRAALAQLAESGFITVDKSGTTSKPPEQTVTASVEVEDLYAVLSVSETATQDEIRRAYHFAAMKTHPDTCKDPGAADRFAELSKAFKVLRDPRLRSRYDKMRSRVAA